MLFRVLYKYGLACWWGFAGWASFPLHLQQLWSQSNCSTIGISVRMTLNRSVHVCLTCYFGWGVVWLVGSRLDWGGLAGWGSFPLHSQQRPHFSEPMHARSILNTQVKYPQPFLAPCLPSKFKSFHPNFFYIKYIGHASRPFEKGIYLLLRSNDFHGSHYVLSRRK